MSFSNPTAINKNPAARFLEWSFDNRSWKYYDNEKKQNVMVPHDIPFTPLDRLITVTGFNDHEKRGLYSNEVRDVYDELVVKCNKRIMTEGPWSEIKEKNRWAKFTTSIYAMAKIDGEFLLVNFKLAGAANSAWIDFESAFQKENNKKRPYEAEIVMHVGEIQERTKGTNTYMAPVFAVFRNEMSEEARNRAIEMDRELQAYLTDYLKKDHAAEPKQAQEEQSPPNDDDWTQPEDAGKPDADCEIPF